MAAWNVALPVTDGEAAAGSLLLDVVTVGGRLDRADGLADIGAEKAGLSDTDAVDELAGLLLVVGPVDVRTLIVAVKLGKVVGTAVATGLANAVRLADADAVGVVDSAGVDRLDGDELGLVVGCSSK